MILPGCFCCSPPPPPGGAYYYPYTPPRISVPTCQTCGTVTFPTTLTLTIVKLDATCACLDAQTLSMTYHDDFTHHVDGFGVPCVLHNLFTTDSQVHDCDRSVFGGGTVGSDNWIHFHTAGTAKCSVSMTLAPSSNCEGVGFYRSPVATRVISCSPINFEFDMNLADRSGYPDSFFCTNPTHTFIITE